MSEGGMYFEIGHPMPNQHHAALLASYHVLLKQGQAVFPVRVRHQDGDHVLSGWEVTRAAFMARMVSTLRHLGYLAPSFSRLEGAGLARTLVEHSITYAWISGDPGDRLSRFLTSSLREAIKKDEWFRGRGDEPGIDPTVIAWMESYIEEHPKGMPRIGDRADAADASWRERIETTLPPSLHIPDFRQLYKAVYGDLSDLDHASTRGLQDFVHRESDGCLSVDGEPDRELDRDLRPYWLGAWAYAEALVISSAASGWPRVGDLDRALRLVATLRQAERLGQLQVRQDESGRAVIAAPE